MHPFIIYQGRNVILTSSHDREIGPAIKLCSTEKQLFLLDTHHDLYIGNFSGENEVEFGFLKRSIIDIDLFDNNLYTITEDGCIYKQPIDRLQEDDWIEISVSKSIDGKKFKLPISRIRCNSIGIIMITGDEELYGVGNFVGILNAIYPTKFECFSGFKVCDISAGDDFFIVLARKESKGTFLYDEDDVSSTSSNSLQKTEYKNIDIADKSPNIQRKDKNVELKRNETLEYEFEEDDDDYDFIERRGSLLSINSKPGAIRNREALKNSIKLLVQRGCDIVVTNVWSFGSLNNGRLGTGDHVKRSSLNSVLNVNGIGVCTISSGREHSMAKTIDGRILQWGSNQRHQICNKTEATDISAPKLVELSKFAVNQPSVIESGCGDYKTVVLKQDLSLVEFCKEAITRELVTKDVIEQGYPIFICSKNFLLQNHKTFVTECQQYLDASQLTVRNCITNIALIKTMQKNVTQKLRFFNEVDQLCQGYISLTYVLALNLQSMNHFYRKDISFHELISIQNTKEFIELFNHYSKLYCGIIAVNGFPEIRKECEKLKSFHSIEITSIFSRPFDEIYNIINLLTKFTAEHENVIRYKILFWQSFREKHVRRQFLAKATEQFWEQHERATLLTKLKQVERFAILESWTIPLKLLNASKFSSNYFILFSDSFCHYGSQLEICPLSTVWVQAEDENSFKIITPEKSFVLTTRNHDDRKTWLTEVQRWCNIALNKQADERIGRIRTAAYVYSDKHIKYPGVQCFGRWNLGLMDGICHLVYPDGKVYDGDIKKGEIEGEGRMLIPSLGMYEGAFKSGKYHGYGVYELKNNEVYKGYFRNGTFHGHGVLQTNFSTYIGGFSNGTKCGYGILDDSLTGDKYMGMFAENERAGAGTCVRMNGDYFEGIYINDKICGEGVAVFENGDYYEGELSLDGPNGRGCYYLPQSQVIENDYEQSSTFMVGNIISGNLGGDWKDVKVVNGAVTFNQRFPKFPRSIGELIVSNDTKWRLLFENWQEQIFDKIDMYNTKIVWEKIAIFMTNSKKKEQSKEVDNLLIKSYFISNCLLQANKMDLSLKNSSSLDKISLRSTNSLYSKRSTLELNPKRKSYSNETLFDRASNLERNFRTFEDKTLFDSLSNFKMLDESRSDSGRSSEERYLANTSNINDNNALCLEFTPSFGMMTSLTEEEFHSIKDYLAKAFKDSYHPLYLLNQKISNSFYLSYGCWKVKPTPLLSTQAMHEWETISIRIYNIVRKMFPALPPESLVIDGTREVVSHISLLYPIVLSEGIYSTLFVLYANKHSQRDECYRQKIMLTEKWTNEELAKMLKVEESAFPMLVDESFIEATSNFKQIKEKYCPREMLKIIEETINLIEISRKTSLDNSVILAADGVMPLVIYLVLRAGVPHLGAELALLEDLIGTDFEAEMSGFAGYCYTTIKASYEHIVSKQLFAS